MRASKDCSDSLETKTELSSDNITDGGVVEEVPRRSQTGALRLDGRKGENGQIDAIASGLEEALERWNEVGNEQQLRFELLALLLKLERI